MNTSSVASPHSEQVHHIETMMLQIDFQRHDDAEEFEQLAYQLVLHELLPAIDQILSSRVNPADTLFIDTLELDVGSINLAGTAGSTHSIKDFFAQLQSRVCEQLIEHIASAQKHYVAELSSMALATSPRLSSYVSSSEVHHWRQLLAFLHKGTLPWPQCFTRELIQNGEIVPPPAQIKPALKRLLQSPGSKTAILRLLSLFSATQVLQLVLALDDHHQQSVDLLLYCLFGGQSADLLPHAMQASALQTKGMQQICSELASLTLNAGNLSLATMFSRAIQIPTLAKHELLWAIAHWVSRENNSANWSADGLKQACLSIILKHCLPAEVNPLLAIINKHSVLINRVSADIANSDVVNTEQVENVATVKRSANQLLPTDQRGQQTQQKHTQKLEFSPELLPAQSADELTANAKTEIDEARQVALLIKFSQALVAVNVPMLMSILSNNDSQAVRHDLTRLILGHGREASIRDAWVKQGSENLLWQLMLLVCSKEVPFLLASQQQYLTLSQLRTLTNTGVSRSDTHKPAQVPIQVPGKGQQGRTPLAQSTPMITSVTEADERRRFWLFTLHFLLADRGGAFNRKAYMQSLLLNLAQAHSQNVAAVITQFWQTLNAVSLDGGIKQQLNQLLTEVWINNRLGSNGVVADENGQIPASVWPSDNNQSHAAVHSPQRHPFKLSYATDGANMSDLIYSLNLAITTGHGQALLPQWSEYVTRYPAALSKSIRLIVNRSWHVNNLVASFTDKMKLEALSLVLETHAEFVLTTIEHAQHTVQQSKPRPILSHVVQDTLWQVTFSYVLLRRGSEFNQRSYLESLIGKTAARHNLHKNHLLSSLLLHLHEQQGPSRLNQQLLRVLTSMAAPKPNSNAVSNAVTQAITQTDADKTESTGESYNYEYDGLTEYEIKGGLTEYEIPQSQLSPIGPGIELDSIQDTDLNQQPDSSQAIDVNHYMIAANDWLVQQLVRHLLASNADNKKDSAKQLCRLSAKQLIRFWQSCHEAKLSVARFISMISDCSVDDLFKLVSRLSPSFASTASYLCSGNSPLLTWLPDSRPSTQSQSTTVVTTAVVTTAVVTPDKSQCGANGVYLDAQLVKRCWLLIFEQLYVCSSTNTNLSLGSPATQANIVSQMIATFARWHGVSFSHFVAGLFHHQADDGQFQRIAALLNLTAATNGQAETTPTQSAVAHFIAEGYRESSAVVKATNTVTNTATNTSTNHTETEVLVFDRMFKYWLKTGLDLQVSLAHGIPRSQLIADIHAWVRDTQAIIDSPLSASCWQTVMPKLLQLDWQKMWLLSSFDLRLQLKKVLEQIRAARSSALNVPFTVNVNPQPSYGTNSQDIPTSEYLGVCGSMAQQDYFSPLCMTDIFTHNAENPSNAQETDVEIYNSFKVEPLANQTKPIQSDEEVLRRLRSQLPTNQLSLDAWLQLLCKLSRPLSSPTQLRAFSRCLSQALTSNPVNSLASLRQYLSHPQVFSTINLVRAETEVERLINSVYSAAVLRQYRLLQLLANRWLGAPLTTSLVQRRRALIWQMVGDRPSNVDGEYHIDWIQLVFRIFEQEYKGHCSFETFLQQTLLNWQQVILALTSSAELKRLLLSGLTSIEKYSRHNFHHKNNVNDSVNDVERHVAKTKTDIESLDCARQSVSSANHDKAQQELGMSNKQLFDAFWQDNDQFKEISEPIYISNAGMVLAAPYIVRLLNMLALTDDNQFIDPYQQEKALYVLQYLVTGDEHDARGQMILNKLLCGIKTAKPVSTHIELSEAEKHTIDSLVSAMIEHWSTLGTTSTTGIRQTFFKREGVLLKEGDAWKLSIPDGSFDMLIDSIPWSFRTIKYPWMEGVLYVDWR